MIVKKIAMMISCFPLSPPVGTWITTIRTDMYSLTENLNVSTCSERAIAAHYGRKEHCTTQEYCRFHLCAPSAQYIPRMVCQCRLNAPTTLHQLPTRYQSVRTIEISFVTEPTAATLSGPQALE